MGSRASGLPPIFNHQSEIGNLRYGIPAGLHAAAGTVLVPAGRDGAAHLRTRGRTERGRVPGAVAGRVAAVRLLAVPADVPRVPEVPVAPRARGNVRARPQPAPRDGRERR